MKNATMITAYKTSDGQIFENKQTADANQEFLEQCKINNKLKEFHILCAPLLKFIKEYHDPHTKIIISYERATLITELIGAKYEY